jgi:hypothetical protein
MQYSVLLEKSASDSVDLLQGEITPSCFLGVGGIVLWITLVIDVVLFGSLYLSPISPPPFPQ